MTLWRLLWAYWRLHKAARALVLDVTALLASPAFAEAWQAVDDAAGVPSARAHHHWREIRRVAKAWEWSGAVHRRLAANEALARVAALPSRQRELLVELAYHCWRAEHPDYDSGPAAWDDEPTSVATSVAHLT